MHSFRAACVVATLALLGCSEDAPVDGTTTTGEPEPTPCSDEEPCPMPEDQVCLVGQCHDGIAPVLEIVSPEQEQSADWTPGGDTTDLEVTVRVRGFQIVDPEIDPTNVRAAGHVILELDGTEVAMIIEGDAAAGVTVRVPAIAAAGPHRLAAHLRLSDGTPYDHPEAAVRRFFWFADGAPRVGVVSPWPGDEFTTGAQPLDVTAATVDFELVPAAADKAPGAVGVVHVFFDAEFPSCGESPACADAYNGVVAPTGPASSALGSVTLPADDASATSILTVHLAHTDHEPYCQPDLIGCLPVWDSVELPRIVPGGM